MRNASLDSTSKASLFRRGASGPATLLMGVATICLATAGCATPPDTELVRIYQRALEAFEQAAGPADYLRSATLYQEILDRGVVSGGLLYNQGNAYMRAGQRGRAIASYRRALIYRPRDAQLRANLQLALGSDIAIDAPQGVLDHIFFWRDWTSYPGKIHASAAVASLAFVLGLAGLWGPRRPLFRRAAWATLGLTLILAASAVYDWRRFEQVERGVVIRSEVIARKGNADSYDPAFNEPLKEGAEFRIIERRGPWVQIQLAGGQAGWIPDSAVVTF